MTHRRIRRSRIALGLLLFLLGGAFAAVGPSLLRRSSVEYGFSRTLGSGLLRQPIGIAYRAGRLYVSDAGNQRIVVLDTAGAVVEAWGGPELSLDRPMHLSFDPGGRLLVSEYLSDRVTVLGLDGAVVERIGGRTGPGPGELDAPGGAAVLAGRIFVADFYNHRVEVFGDDAPRTVGRPGRVLAGRLHYPTDVAADDSLLYVADAYNHRVQVFRPDGTFVRRWGGAFGFGGRGGLKGWFRVATGLEVEGGRVYVADFENHRVQLFTDRGRYLGQVEDSLRRPTDVAVGGSGELYVVDFGHDRIVRFDPGPGGA